MVPTLSPPNSGRSSRSCLVESSEAVELQYIVVSVVVPFKLDDLEFPRKRPSYPYSQCRGLRTREHESHELGTGKHLHKPLRHAAGEHSLLART